MPSPGRPPFLEAIWFKDQFEDLHKEHALILKRIDDLENKLDIFPVFVIPELETQILKAAALGKKIDEKVPDKNVPPTK